ncbi:hypothetical protein [Halocalculus aciditolerans]|uniref:Big-1 domain-containing protein n=1 Tax=Halocalculus aciditolerans TaxID=1383812 RepID=A0A830FBG9_9EURY|nr:hypothetical protein [Halocalculus aciditolerans]GGL58503.1 hypothetical protein GCM10009039_15910 [Halocalculus aciditolerans]
MRDLSGGERGQAVVVGVVVFLGFIVALAALYQLQVVPLQTLQHEYAHEQAVDEDLTALNAQLVRAATEGEPTATTVAVGQDYSSSLLFRTPPPLSGRLTAQSAGSVSVSNVDVTEEARKSPAGNAYGPYETNTVTYTPQYVQYSNAPDTVLSGGQVLDRYPNGETTRVSGSSFVSGRQVTLVTVTGSPGEAEGLRQTVTAVPASAATDAVSVTNTPDERVTIRVPTVRSQEAWDATLDAQTVANGGHVVSKTVSDGVLTVVLEPGVTYDLRLARVDLGGGESASEPAVDVGVVSGGARSVPPGGSQRVVVEAYDRFGNPVSGVRIAANTPSGWPGRVRSTDRLGGSRTVAVTGENGRASFVVKSSETDVVNTGSVTYTVQS